VWRRVSVAPLKRKTRTAANVSVAQSSNPSAFRRWAVRARVSADNRSGGPVMAPGAAPTRRLRRGGRARAWRPSIATPPVAPRFRQLARRKPHCRGRRRVADDDLCAAEVTVDPVTANGARSHHPRAGPKLTSQPAADDHDCPRVNGFARFTIGAEIRDTAQAVIGHRIYPKGTRASSSGPATVRPALAAVLNSAPSQSASASTVPATPSSSARTRPCGRSRLGERRAGTSRPAAGHRASPTPTPF
jgi:hypothetical protein